MDYIYVVTNMQGLPWAACATENAAKLLACREFGFANQRSANVRIMRTPMMQDEVAVNEHFPEMK